jgi:thiamine kinase-like enzyme
MARTRRIARWGHAHRRRVRTLHPAEPRSSPRSAGLRHRLVPCHNDLLPGNVLFADDRVWLLDFEYAG